MQTTLPLGQKIDNWIEISKVTDGMVRVRSALAERLIKEEKDLVIVNFDNFEECVRLDGYELAMGVKRTTAMTYHNETEGPYTINQYTYKPEPSKTYLSKTELKLLLRFHPSWFNPLRSFFPELLDILRQLKAERDVKTIYPDGEHQFRIFSETNLNMVKAVIVLQDPYSNGVANGIPMAVDDSIPKPVTMQMFEKKLKRPIGDTTLKTVIKQGVLLLNTAWTVEKGLPASHGLIWEPFTKRIMEIIGGLEKTKVVLLLGKQAQNYSDVLGTNHIIVKAEHPSKAAREKREWNDNKAVETLLGYYNTEYATELVW